VKKFLRIIAPAAALAALVAVALVLSDQSAQSQFNGYFAQQTVTKTFSVAAPNATKIALTNFGQAGHSVLYTAASTTTCAGEVRLEVSQDGTTYSTAAVGLTVNAALGGTQTSFYASGYFPWMRLNLNPHGEDCTGVTFAGTYVGYQLPISIPVSSLTAIVSASTGTKISVFNTGIHVSDIYSGPYYLKGFDCTNPGGSTAYLQLIDGASSGIFLGAGELYEVPIPAGLTVSRTFNLPGVPGVQTLWVGAATTFQGSTAVGTPVDCTIEWSYAGPFWPLISAAY
jgi:hypothetical protein